MKSKYEKFISIKMYQSLREGQKKARISAEQIEIDGIPVLVANAKMTWPVVCLETEDVIQSI